MYCILYYVCIQLKWSEYIDCFQRFTYFQCWMIVFFFSYPHSHPFSSAPPPFSFSLLYNFHRFIFLHPMLFRMALPSIDNFILCIAFYHMCGQPFALCITAWGISRTNQTRNPTTKNCNFFSSGYCLTSYPYTSIFHFFWLFRIQLPPRRYIIYQ